MIKISRILALPFYEKTSEESEFIKLVNTEIKSFVSDGKINVTFQLNADKSNKTKFYFENLSFTQDMKNLLVEAKFRLGIPILIFIFISILFSLNIGGGNQFMVWLVVALIIGSLKQIFSFFKLFLFVPKKLILKNRHIYELNFLNIAINEFSFTEIKGIELDDCAYFIFKTKQMFFKEKRVNEGSLIIFSEIMSEKSEIIEFFQNYAKICINTDFSILDLKSKISL